MTLTITAFERSPDGGQGLARDTRVRWALEEVGQPYEVRLVSFQALREPAHLALHPFGQIPTCEDDGIALFESGAIVLHIAQRHAGLLPQGEPARARAIAWMFAAVNTVEPPILELAAARLFERERPWYAERLPLLQERVRQRLGQLARWLGDAPWLEFSGLVVDPSALSMGATAENLHDRFPGITKERADAYAVRSQQKVAAAYAAGKIQPDLVPTAIRSAEQGWGLATEDEPPRPGTTMDDLAMLKTPFRVHGNVTAGNAAGLNDGATACLLAAEDVARDLGLAPKMRLVDFSFSGVEPEVMGVGPVPATEKLLARNSLTMDDIGLIEINEAFAVQVLAFLEHFKIADDDARVNPWGGAIAIGHPLASSGVRLMNQLARLFEERTDVRYGLTTMCVGMGMGGTVLWENVKWEGAK